MQSNRVAIKYPARLVVNGETVHDCFPDWDSIVHKSRVAVPSTVTRPKTLSTDRPVPSGMNTGTRHPQNLTRSDNVMPGSSRREGSPGDSWLKDSGTRSGFQQTGSNVNSPAASQQQSSGKSNGDNTRRNGDNTRKNAPANTTIGQRDNLRSTI